jgi:hypothetical protein
MHLLTEQYLMLAELVADPGTGLEWQHFDPKVTRLLIGC